MNKSNKTIQNCIVCQNPASLMCQRCRDYYCSTYCQAFDWPQHKNNCIPMPSLVPVKGINFAIPPHINPLSNRLDPLFNVTNRLNKVDSDSIEQLEEKTAKNVLNGFPKNTEPIDLISDSNSNVSSSMRESTKKTLNNCDSVVAPSSQKIDKPNNCDNKTNNIIPTTNNKHYDANIILASMAPQENNKKNYPGLLQDTRIDSGTDKPIKNIQISTRNDEAASRTVTVVSSIPVEVIENKSVEKPNEFKARITVKTNESSAKSCVSVRSVQGSKVEQSSNWQKTFTVPEKEYFKVDVQYVSEEDGTCWVIPESLDSECTKLLKEINKNITRANPNVLLRELKMNCLFAVPFEDLYYRGVILAEPNPLNEVMVRLVDYGNTFYANCEDVKQCIPLMKNLNAFAFQIRFSKAQTVQIGDKLNIKVLSMDADGVYVVEDEKNPANDFFTLANIDIVEIPQNKPTKLYCLDSSCINNGYITACILDTKQINKIDTVYAQELAKYCETLSVTEYIPMNDEVCLAIFEEDNNWYRAVSVGDEKNKTFLMMFVDYGNVNRVSSTNIRPISKDFLYKTLANSCVLEGIPKEMDAMTCEKVGNFFMENPVFEIEKATKIDGEIFSLLIPDLLKTII